MNEPKPLFSARRRYFVNREIQGRLVLGVLGAVGFSFVMVLTDYYFSFGQEAGWDPRMLEIFLKAQKLPMIQLVVFAFALAFVTIWLSHRVAGPLVNLEKSLSRLAEGDLTTRIQLRPKDKLKDIRDAFNCMVESLQKRVVADRQRARELDLSLGALADIPGLPPAAVAEVKKVREVLLSLTGEFKV
jgi:methyl-accepting chemotaxis protein